MYDGDGGSSELARRLKEHSGGGVIGDGEGGAVPVVEGSEEEGVVGGGRHCESTEARLGGLWVANGWSAVDQGKWADALTADEVDLSLLPASSALLYLC